MANNKQEISFDVVRMRRKKLGKLDVFGDY